MPSIPSPEEVAALCERTRALCKELTAVRQELAETRQQALRLVEQARRVRPDIAWQPCSERPEHTAYQAPLALPAESHEAAMETLRTMRALLDGFSPEWQIRMVQALAMRTAIVVHQQQRAQVALSA